VVAPLISLPLVAPAPRLALDDLQGRLTELCAPRDGAALSCAFSLVYEAQKRDEPAAYVGGVDACFFPPDAADGGIDLDALVVIRIAEVAARARAAEELLRSGAFALVVIDLIQDDVRGQRVPPAMLTRLLGLAQKHHSALVFVSSAPDKDAPSPLGSLVSLRAVVRRRLMPDDAAPPLGPRRARYVVAFEAVKDKRRAPGWCHEQVFRGPKGLA
jgi:recombination protein RecA